jgi:hypothetical protein
VVGEGYIVIWVLGCRDEKIEQGVGYFTPKLPMPSPRNHYHLPIKTEDREHGRSVVGEGDIVAWVLGCWDEKIVRGWGISLPKC